MFVMFHITHVMTKIKAPSASLTVDDINLRWHIFSLDVNPDTR